MTTILLDRLGQLQSRQRVLKKRIEDLEKGLGIYTYLAPGSATRARELNEAKGVNYTLELARSGLLIVERILKEMKRLIEAKISTNNNVYVTSLDLLKGELSCIAKLFVYDKIDIYNNSGWEWEIGNTTYNWGYDLSSSINSIDYTSNGPGKIDKITANIAQSYIEIDAILLNVNINNSALLDVDETNRIEVVDKRLYEELTAITTEINTIINHILETV